LLKFYIDVTGMFRFVIILLFYYLCPSKLEGQGIVKFQHLNSTHGLSDNNVTAITSDNNGFLWMGTDKGLNFHFQQLCSSRRS